ncbi:carbohydrate sulfotransferase 1-like [Saccoglossus kowalevskii]|uniref:Carbohydrate sulfotransferase 3-like n=1 Tax=Saccoglossus kowalevskii TaxID=10224 RepID=A0ABM0M400_SACKO|nr:PREDICTED: carbohydrate sulfotransferase 3-like [Saccoglossus kowalevskii]
MPGDGTKLNKKKEEQSKLTFGKSTNEESSHLVDHEVEAMSEPELVSNADLKKIVENGFKEVAVLKASVEKIRVTIAFRKVLTMNAELRKWLTLVCVVSLVTTAMDFILLHDGYNAIFTIMRPLKGTSHLQQLYGKEARLDKILNSKNMKRRKNVYVILFSRFRTGSSFTGQLFNQNPNIFYYFEPLHASVDGTNGVQLLNKLLQCRFPPKYATELRRWKIAVAYSKAIQNVCRKYNQCSMVPPVVLSKECAKRQSIAAKIIRASSLRELESLLDSYGTSIKLIHLVRDPRGVVNSRYVFPVVNKTHVTRIHNGITDNIREYCEWMTNNSDYVDASNLWTSNNYKLVRYEDIASNPIKMAVELYRFVGIPLHKKVLEWINFNTRQSNPTIDNNMSTTKNSTAVAQSWRSTLHLVDVQHVQAVCFDAMDMFGYTMVWNNVELLNMTQPLW